MRHEKRERINLTNELEKIRKENLPEKYGKYPLGYYAHHDYEMESWLDSSEECKEYIFGIPEWTSDGWAIRKKLSGGFVMNIEVDVDDYYI